MWEELCVSHVDIDSLTGCITELLYPPGLYIVFQTANSDMKALLKEKKRAFRLGNKEELKTVQKELRTRPAVSPVSSKYSMIV